MTLVLIDAVGLTPRALAHMPRLRSLAGDGFQARLDPVLPAVTCSVQSSILTGLTPTDHGIVEFRSTAALRFRQSRISRRPSRVKPITTSRIRSDRPRWATSSTNVAMA